MKKKTSLTNHRNPPPEVDRTPYDKTAEISDTPNTFFTYQFRAHGVAPPERQGVLDRGLPLHPFAQATAVLGQPPGVNHSVEPPGSGVYANDDFVAVAVDLHVRRHFRGA